MKLADGDEVTYLDRFLVLLWLVAALISACWMWGLDR